MTEPESVTVPLAFAAKIPLSTTVPPSVPPVPPSESVPELIVEVPV